MFPVQGPPRNRRQANRGPNYRGTNTFPRLVMTRTHQAVTGEPLFFIMISAILICVSGYDKSK